MSWCSEGLIPYTFDDEDLISLPEYGKDLLLDIKIPTYQERVEKLLTEFKRKLVVVVRK